MKAILSLARDVWSLFYPHLCLICGQQEPPGGEPFCLGCQLKLPQTGFHHLPENAFTERFWGRLRLEGGASIYYFTKGGRVQRLIHRLKYNGKQEIGRHLGRWYGKQLLEKTGFREVTLIVPVPLHPRKLRLRGYNQSVCFAEGLSEALGVPWRNDVLRRRTHTATQTHKSRMERLENVLTAFELTCPEAIAGQHVLLVDDVLTTGATLEACGLQLLAAPGVRVSMATIAIAQLG